MEGDGQVDSEEPSKEEKQERGSLIVKLKIPPRGFQPLLPPILIESDDEDDECEL